MWQLWTDQLEDLLLTYSQISTRLKDVKVVLWSTGAHRFRRDYWFILISSSSPCSCHISHRPTTWNTSVVIYQIGIICDPVKNVLSHIQVWICFYYYYYLFFIYLFDKTAKGRVKVKGPFNTILLRAPNSDKRHHRLIMKSWSRILLQIMTKYLIWDLNWLDFSFIDSHSINSFSLSIKALGV